MKILNETNNSWCVAALSEQVTAEKPIGVFVDGVAMALFRNEAGQPCAVEDRCPHRRVPLSLGKVVDGSIRCAYHGWTFDGESGVCVAIPNLGPDEKTPERYRVPAIRVRETGGFVYASVSAGNVQKVEQDSHQFTAGKEIIGTAISGLPVEQYLAALLDGPCVLVKFFGLAISDFTIANPEIRDNALVVDRAAVWQAHAKRDLRFHSEFHLTLRVTTPVDRGLVTINVLDSAEQVLASLRLSATEGRRGTTNICWRANISSAYRTVAPLTTRLHPAFRQRPVDVYKQFDTAAIAALLPGPSQHLPASILKPDQRMRAAQLNLKGFP